MATGGFGLTRVKLGLELTEVTPKSSQAYSWIKAQTQYFGWDFLMVVFKDGTDFRQRWRDINDMIFLVRNSTYVIPMKPGEDFFRTYHS